MAIRMEPKPAKPSKLERQRALLSGQAPLKTKADVVKTITSGLPAMIDAAARQLRSATTAAEVLEAKSAAGIAYDVAKMSGRIAKAKDAHDKVVAAAHRAQADALEIEAQAKRRLADEYDGAQERGEVAKVGRPKIVPHGNNIQPATAVDIGMDRKEIVDARQVRDAIAANPSIVKEALSDILERGDEPTRAALKKAIAPTVKAIRAETQVAKKERRAERETILAERIVALPDRKFGVIYADPEWEDEHWSEETGSDRAAANHYPVSPAAVIASRPVPSIAADDCVLWLWTTNQHLRIAIDVLEAWGFAYASHYVWGKDKIGLGRWNRSKHEILLIGVRGDPVAPAPGTQADSLLMAPRGEHSAKPDLFAEMIERYYPNIPKIELNRRGPARPGWVAWGTEAEAA